MLSKSEIEQKILKLKQELNNVKGTPTKIKYRIRCKEYDKNQKPIL